MTLTDKLKALVEARESAGDRPTVLPNYGMDGDDEAFYIAAANFPLRELLTEINLQKSLYDSVYADLIHGQTEAMRVRDLHEAERAKLLAVIADLVNEVRDDVGHSEMEDKHAAIISEARSVK